MLSLATNIGVSPVYQDSRNHPKPPPNHTSQTYCHIKFWMSFEVGGRSCKQSTGCMSECSGTNWRLGPTCVCSVCRKRPLARANEEHDQWRPGNSMGCVAVVGKRGCTPSFLQFAPPHMIPTLTHVTVSHVFTHHVVDFNQGGCL